MTRKNERQNKQHMKTMQNCSTKSYMRIENNDIEEGSRKSKNTGK